MKFFKVAILFLGIIVSSCDNIKINDYIHYDNYEVQHTRLIRKGYYDKKQGVMVPDKVEYYYTEGFATNFYILKHKGLYTYIQEYDISIDENNLLYNVFVCGVDSCFTYNENPNISSFIEEHKDLILNEAYWGKYISKHCLKGGYWSVDIRNTREYMPY